MKNISQIFPKPNLPASSFSHAEERMGEFLIRPCSTLLPSSTLSEQEEPLTIESLPNLSNSRLTSSEDLLVFFFFLVNWQHINL